MSEFISSEKSFALKIASFFFKGIIVVNYKLKAWAEKELNCRNVVYLPNFTTIDNSTSTETILKGELGKRILCLANLRDQKNHFLLLEVAEKLKQSHPDWTFHLVGKDFEDAYSIAIKNKIKELQLEKEKTRNIIGATSSGAVVLGLLGFLYYRKQKHIQEKRAEVYKTETRISKKVHDEVANDLYRVMTKIQKTQTIKDDVLDDLEVVYNKTRDISKEHSIIDIQGTYEAHLRDLLLSYRNDTVNIITKDLSRVNWERLDAHKKMALHRVLQELMTNMRKHSKATLVVLTFSQKGKKIHIAYKDNGVGAELVKNNGLRNTENRMESINGTITFESQLNNGFKASLSL